MSAVRIGIITCGNVTSDLSCCAIACLSAFNKKTGPFAEYKDDIVLAGIISCAGCPTLAYPEKILDKAAAMTRFGVKHIHFSNCMEELCPFINKYKQAIARAWPEVTMVAGTHPKHISARELRAKVKTAFEQKRNMSDIISGDI